MPLAVNPADAPPIEPSRVSFAPETAAAFVTETPRSATTSAAVDDAEVDRGRVHLATAGV
jgi:hypothetical protein